MIKNKFLARTVLAVGSVACISLPSGYAQEVYSNIIGAVSMKVPAESDLFVTPSFANSAVFRAQAASASAGSVTFTDAGFEVDAYASGHLLLVEEGTLAGRMFKISSNNATTLTLIDTKSELSAAALKTAAIVPELTLGGMFPNGIGGKVEINPGNPDIYLFSNNNSAGVEGFAPESIYYYGDIALDDNDEIVRVPGWRKVGAPLSESRDSDSLPLGEGFVIRNNSGVDVSFFLFGEVMLSQVKIPISSSASGTTDNLVGVPRPLAVPLDELGLASKDEVTGALSPNGIVAETTAANAVKDTVRVFLNSASGKNKAPDAIYCLYQNGSTYEWREVVDGVVVTSGAAFNGELLPASAAFVIRKLATSEDQTVYWTNNWDLPTQS